mmetsp:Transcript_25710/g.33682  ORF Transcript_25710/g.33682 Transcript_25710/m.33682 type:complete len:376 (-) Transcript_25710:256-1383(-)|eukprot:CAMPEP_0117752452 /NCGR_PEP_ID=MMETSP0947-20121206/11615_1 /TAXON_ID=44440 /ORGANISM="Chattonella subsalsa, Strain CCMP2191" /LENGTH=375 /DNA_ID=CAMNT_0005571099 /DNA_START=97 /DNA_END=1224 /DNA_ORIENTATION=+
MASNENGDQTQLLRKPEESAFKQQKMKAWQPILYPKWVISSFFLIGVLFIIIGGASYSSSNSVVEYKFQYDGDGAESNECKIDRYKEGKNCTISFEVQDDMEQPIYVYYQLTNFYQNHRRYVQSRYDSQLQGEELYPVEDYCSPLTRNNTQDLNPCGLVANSLFNDIIVATSHVMKETDISWESDREYKFAQPPGFEYRIVGEDAGSCTNATMTCSCYEVFGDTNHETCEKYEDFDGTVYYYFYPDNDNIQYLYETFPEVISPIEGVTNEHFIVWMRTAALPSFRKLYGIIETDVSAGDTITFDITSNYLVSAFDGTKAIVIGTGSWFGGQNPYLGISYLIVGVICVVLSISFLIKHCIAPRQPGDDAFLIWKEQ